MLFALLSTAYAAVAQNVGINSTGTTLDAAAVLDLNTGTNFTCPNGKGILFPNVAPTGTGDIATLASAPTSLMVYNTATAVVSPNDVLPGFYYWNGAKWVAFNGPGGRDWTLTGNAGTTVGTNFLGTTGATDLALYTNNSAAMRINSSGFVGINTTSPIEQFSVVSSSDAAGFGYQGFNSNRILLAAERSGTLGAEANVGVIG